MNLRRALMLVVWNVATVTFAQKPIKNPSPIIFRENKLSYTPDSLGNRVPDFSYCGYKAGNEAIPSVEVVVTVPVPTTGDATAKIQSAIDYVASLPINKDGFRGAVLLQKGTYKIAGSLKINTSGVVLRGANDNLTVLLGTGVSREAMVIVGGKNDKKFETMQPIIDSYVPVNGRGLSVATPAYFKVGDAVVVHRPSTKKWIETIDNEHFGGGITSLGWKAGQREVFWDRTVVAINDNKLSLDAPLTTALDSTFGISSISKYTWQGRISNVGVENIQVVSTFDKNNRKDEAHRWFGVVLQNVTDAWVRRVVFKHLAGSAVIALQTASRITVEDCKSLAPIAEIGGQRRQAFFTTGQQTLFQRLYSEEGYHDFGVGFCAAGPNAFVQCEAHNPLSFSGTTDSWASGVLFDIVNIDGQMLSFANRGQDGQGAGWCAANSVFWQCTAAKVQCQSPPTAQNWAFGTWAQFDGNGYWESSNEHIKPRSLYYAQLRDRIGVAADTRTVLMPTPTEASSSPSVETAAILTQQATRPTARLEDLIDTRLKLQILNTANVVTIPTKKASTTIKSLNKQIVIKNGWLTYNNAVVTGKRQEVPWWNGSARPYGLPTAKAHITRFVPGQTGTGLTDDLEELTKEMQRTNVCAIDHNYGLWYDRRRDDHERIRRIDGDVWPPFYELPFARTGIGTAYDGLSKYDLTKYNSWYWLRLRQFADLADQKGLTLIHQNYFQHNIIEAGAHYTDFPWRPANNINQTGFAEPAPYAGDKRIFLAEQFYDISNPTRRKIHKAYIRQCLDNFSANQNVIQFIGAEFTGPLHFVQFWLDTIDEWQKQTHKNVLVGLSTTKDVQDAILADTRRANIIDIIDIRYWHNQANGTIYAPQGGQNLAPRQHARLLNPKKTSLQQTYQAVYQYRKKYPNKAVIYNADSQESMAWAVFMAGGSMSNIPIKNTEFLTDVAQSSSSQLTDNQWILNNNNQSYIIYNNTQQAMAYNVPVGDFKMFYVNIKNGEVHAEKLLTGPTIIDITTQNPLIWIKKLTLNK